MIYYHIIIFWLIGWLLLSRLKFLTREDKSLPLSHLSIIIPARNEEKNLSKLLGSLKDKNCEIIVVDDNSNDNTALIAQTFPNVRLITLKEEPPAGWIGKSWACWNGYLHSSGKLLLFIDADVELHNQAIESLLAYYEKTNGLVSVWPYQKLEKPYEHLLMPFNLIAITVLSNSILLGKSGGAYGPVILTSRHDYEKTGGHQAVKGMVVEDLALGKVYLQNNLPLNNLLGSQLIKFRMYPDNLGQLVEGLAKNIVSGALNIGVLKIVALFLWLTGIYSSFFPENLQFTNWLYYLLFASQLYFINRKTGDFSLFDALLYPLHFTIFLLIFLYSFLRRFVLKQVIWKGRKINV